VKERVLCLHQNVTDTLYAHDSRQPKRDRDDEDAPESVANKND
jgi:hypothetical protein